MHRKTIIQISVVIINENFRFKNKWDNTFQVFDLNNTNFAKIERIGYFFRKSSHSEAYPGTRALKGNSARILKIFFKNFYVEKPVEARNNLKILTIPTYVRIQISKFSLLIYDLH